MLDSLDGATVVVVGASSGLGLATARAAAGEGADVVMVARDPDRLERARGAVGDRARAHALDVVDADAVADLFAGLDRVDHVVSFAGEQSFGSVDETTHELFQRSIDARVWSARNLCAAAVPRMRGTGSLTFCSGTTAHRPRPNRGGGAAASAAIENYVRALAIELAPIRVNTLCPGVFDTPMVDRVMGPDREQLLAELAERVPAGRIGDPDEAADAALFLMRNTYVTGIVLKVDGGFTLT